MTRNLLSQGEEHVDGLPALNKLCGKILSQWGDRCIVLLSGPMGAGKTQFVRSCLQRFDQLQTCSPSFALHNRYQLGDKEVDHVDLFRLEDEDDLESTGFWDLFAQEKAWIFIEWSERIDDRHLPWNWPLWKIQITPRDNGRILSWQQFG